MKHLAPSAQLRYRKRLNSVHFCSMRPLVNCRSLSLASRACLKDLLHFPISESACVISGHRLNCLHHQERKFYSRWYLMLPIPLKHEHDSTSGTHDAVSSCTLWAVALGKQECALAILHLLSKCGRSLHHRPILRHRCKKAPFQAIAL